MPPTDTSAAPREADFNVPPPPDEGVTRNLGFLVGSLVIVSAIVALTLTSFDEEIYYLTVAEADARYDEILDREFRLKGTVVPETHLLREGVLNQHRFEVEAEGIRAVVDFTGPLPDTFADEAEVIALGRFSEPLRFEASEVIAKCPSRYEESAPTASRDQTVPGA